MQSLFPQRSGPRQPPSLISFKAGKLIFSPRQPNGKFLITPDKRRGTVSFSKLGDGLYHVQWADRSSGQVETDLILMPDDADFKKVKTGRENDRVFMLKFRSGNRDPLMFWMQEKLPEKDTEHLNKLNEYANNPAAAEAAVAAAAAAAAPAAGAGAGAGMGGLTAEQWSQMMGLPAPTAPGASSSGNGAGAGAAVPPGLGNLDLSSLLSMIGAPPPPAAAVAATPAAAANTTTAATPATRALTAEDLRRAMMDIGSTPGGFGNSSLAALAAAEQAEQSRRVGLQDIVTPDGVFTSGVLDDAEVRASLIEQLPDGQRTDAHLEETLRSPQFRQALRSLTHALQSDNFSSIMANLSINPEAGLHHMLRGDAVRAFVAALQAAEGQSDPAPTTPGPHTASSDGNNDGGESKGNDGDSKMDE